MAASKVVDVDGHIMEPADLWEKNLEVKYKDRALRIRKDEDGLEYLEIDGQKSEIFKGGTLASFGAAGASYEELREKWFKPGVVDWEDGRPPGAKDPHARIKWMDEQGIDVCLLYPTIGLTLDTECRDSKLLAAYCRVYNDWLVDFCKPYPDRLISIAHIPLLDIEEGVIELKRVAKLGMKGIFLSAHPAKGIPYGDRFYDPVWAEAQDMGMPVSIHVINNPKYVGHHLYPLTDAYAASFFFNVMFIGDVQLAFTSFFEGAVFERFPRLKVVVLETGCGWIAHWVEYMNARKRISGFDSEMKLRPSEYFERQCWISGEPDEKGFPTTAQQVGAHKLLWASDYPHSEGHADPVEELKETVGCLSQAEQGKILGENALKLYNLS